MFNLEIIKDELDKLDQFISDKNFLIKETQLSKSIIDYVTKDKGKRVRATLFLLSAKLFDYKKPYLIEMASVCELIHLASLIHDDIIDDGKIRRHRASSNKIWGNAASVLVGDIIYAQASILSAKSGSIKIAENFAETVRKMCEGEMLQIENINNLNMNFLDYLKIIKFKTGFLIGNSIKTAAILSNQTSKIQNKLFNFGMHIGTAFQLIDDAIDFSNKTGKSCYKDLMEGKITAPIIFLRDSLKKDKKKYLNEIFQEKNNTKTKNINWILKMIQEYDTINSTIKLAKIYTRASIKYLYYFPKSNIRDQIEQFTKSLLKREF